MPICYSGIIDTSSSKNDVPCSLVCAAGSRTPSRATVHSRTVHDNCLDSVRADHVGGVGGHTRGGVEAKTARDTNRASPGVYQNRGVFSGAAVSIRKCVFITGYNDSQWRVLGVPGTGHAGSVRSTAPVEA